MEHAVLVCVPNASLSSSVAPCTDVDGVASSPALVKSYLMTPDQGSIFEEGFSYESAAAFWFLAFSSTILLWVIAKGAGTVLNMIKRA